MIPSSLWTFRYIRRIPPTCTSLFHYHLSYRGIINTRKYCTNTNNTTNNTNTKPTPITNQTNTTNNTNNNDPKIKSNVPVPTPTIQALLVEKSVTNNTYKKTYFVDNTNKKEHQPKSHAGQHRVFLFIKNCFLPEGYPNTVASDYASYQSWVFLQNIAGSTAYFLSTQALLTAVGVGTAAAAPAAAATSWILRDGIGSVGLMLFAGKFANHLDADIKRSKFGGDILHNIGVGIEILTPLFPGNFLLLGSIANLMKAIAGLILGATKASFNKMFSLAENMADVTAKNQSQGLLSYTIGSGIGWGLTYSLPSTVGWHLTAYLCLAAVHLWGSIRGLSNVTLNTLNEQRSNVVLEEYFHTSEIAVPAKVKQFERLLVSKPHLERPRIVLGQSIKDTFDNDVNLIQAAINLHQNEKYLINYRHHKINVVLHEGLAPLDLLRAYYHAYYIKTTLFLDGPINSKVKALDDPHWLERVHTWRSVQSGLENVGKLPPGWAEKSLEFTRRNFDSFVVRLGRAGWNTSNILLTARDKRSIWQHETQPSSEKYETSG